MGPEDIYGTISNPANPKFEKFFTYHWHREEDENLSYLVFFFSMIEVTSSCVIVFKPNAFKTVTH